MSKRLNLLIIGSFALLMTGCGQTVVEKLGVTPTAPYNAVGQGKTVVILPFADYSASNIASAQKRNVVISEALTDKLVLNGFGLPVQEDVFGFLVKENIIATHQSNSMQEELSSKEWSEAMKDILRAEMGEQNKNNNENGLTTKEIKKIGKVFNADYVMRGRILEYKTRQDASGAPWKAGILPFVVGGTSRSLFGFIDADSYDGQSNWSKGTAMSQVELRLWAQDAATGEVIWTNHTTIEASRDSVFADPQHDALFTAAVERSACLLIHDFAMYGMQQ